jgi:hypothetical protein
MKHFRIDKYLENEYQAIIYEFNMGRGSEHELFESLCSDILAVANFLHHTGNNKILFSEMMWWALFFKERAKLSGQQSKPPAVSNHILSLHHRH